MALYIDGVAWTLEVGEQGLGLSSESYWQFALALSESYLEDVTCGCLLISLFGRRRRVVRRAFLGSRPKQHICIISIIGTQMILCNSNLNAANHTAVVSD